MLNFFPKISMLVLETVNMDLSVAVTNVITICCVFPNMSLKIKKKIMLRKNLIFNDQKRC